MIPGSGHTNSCGQGQTLQLFSRLCLSLTSGGTERPISTILIASKLDNLKAASTQETDHVGVLCREAWVSRAGMGKRFYHMPFFSPFQFCTMGMYYFIKFNQTKKIK